MSTAYTKLREQFPVLQSSEEVKREIQANPDLYAMYLNWGYEEQEQFLDFVTGNKGTKTTYDFMFQQIMNPDPVPERLEDFLSLVLKQKVKIIEKLENKEHFMDENSLLETDVVVCLYFA